MHKTPLSLQANYTLMSQGANAIRANESHRSFKMPSTAGSYALDTESIEIRIIASKLIRTPYKPVQS